MIFKIVKYIYHLLIYFGFLFEIPIFGSITTRRVSVLIALVTLLIKWKVVRQLVSMVNRQRLWRAIGLLLGCLILVFLTTSIVERNPSSSYMEPWHLLNVFLYVLVFAIYTVVEFKDFKAFAWSYIGAFLVQVPVVFYAAINDSFRLFVYSTFYFGDDRFERSIEVGTRIMGIALNSSLGSIICSTVVAVLTLLVLRRQIAGALYFLLTTLFVAMTMFIGRTGVVIEALLVLYYIVNSGKKRILSNTIFIIAAGFIFISIMSNILESIDSGTSEKMTSWMTAVLDPEERQGTANNIHRTLPGFSLEFILGTGVRGGVTPSGNMVDSDSGYVINYSALGIIGSIMYYIANYNMYMMASRYSRKKLYRHFFVLLIILSFLIEYKEPFMMKYIFSYIIVTLGLFNVFDPSKANS